MVEAKCSWEVLVRVPCVRDGGFCGRPGAETAVSFGGSSASAAHDAAVQKEICHFVSACVVMAVRRLARRPLSLVLNWVGIAPMRGANRSPRPVYFPCPCRRRSNEEGSLSTVCGRGRKSP